METIFAHLQLKKGETVGCIMTEGGHKVGEEKSCEIMKSCESLLSRLQSLATSIIIRRKKKLKLCLFVR